MFSLINPESVKGLVCTTTDRANGSQSFSAKRLARKDFIAQRGLKDASKEDIQKAYHDYLKGHDSVPPLLMEAFRQQGLVFSSTGATKNKKGEVTTAYLRYALPPKVKQKSESKEIADRDATIKAQLEELAKLRAENESMKKLLE